MAQSGGRFEANKFSGPCEVSRPTIANYLAVLGATFVAHVVRPFSGRSAAEIKSAPKVYAFDTGFVWYYRGWRELRPEDEGMLWEHFVLNEIQAHLQTRRIHYWRDKSGHEVDLILARRGRPPVSIECKRSAADFDPRGLRALRAVYPDGHNYVVTPGSSPPAVKKYRALNVCFLDLPSLMSRLIRLFNPPP